LKPFALLDDCDASVARPTSRLYTGLAGELVSHGPEDVDAVCAEAERASREGLHAVVLADYEWGARTSVDRIVTRAASAIVRTAADAETRREAPQTAQREAQAGTPALRFLLFMRCELLSREAVDCWLAEADVETGRGVGAKPADEARVDVSAGVCTEAEADTRSSRPPAAAGLARVEADTSRTRFDAAIESIHEALERGDTYQINYTYRLGFEVFGSPIALYRRLRARQPVRYGALIALPDRRVVLSCSPELFLEHEAGRLRAQPMKGTAARVADPEADAHVRATLRADPKNRAENLMIVDLLRNDIGRVARTGSVTVPALFSVDAYGRVWQMTSTVEARIRPELSFAQILRALFPCGSITGAPKHRAMELIAELETSPRGLYTGSIGWLDAPTAAQRCGNFCLSVAIRTLVLDASGHRGEMGVGAGIVLDSVAASEWEECKVKADFATGNDPGLAVFETMRASRTRGVAHLDRHLARLVHSAAELGMKFDPAAILELINGYLPQLSDGDHRVKVTLGADGHASIGGGPLTALPEGPVTVLFADEHGFAPTDASDPLLHYKTTRRAIYDRAWRVAETQGAFDMLFFNTSGELTEGGRTNVFVKLDGRWWTPPVDCGLLPGVMRAVVLEDPQWQAAERVLTRDDVQRADALMICNALRGPLLATPRHDAPL
jgi:para-aminobenzoate synthetase / 4-amino-4-deoxychorismate lyase